MSSSDETGATSEGLGEASGQALQRAYGRLREVLGAHEEVAQLTNEELQQLLAVACKAYALQQEDGNRFPAFGSAQAETCLTATDAAFVASAVLDALQVEVFELGLWRTWGTT